MTKKKLVIADITSLKSGNRSFGHFFYVANMYNKIFQHDFHAKVAGGPIYQQEFETVNQLKYDVNLEAFNKTHTKFFSKIKEVFNARQVLKDKENECIIFQSYSNKVLFLAILMFNSKNKIFLIQYKDELKSAVSKLLFKLIRKRISGIIVPKDSIGKSYKVPYIVVPDYIYIDESKNKGLVEQIEYDYGVFGIIRPGKDVVGVAKLFAEKDLKLIIAGSIQDKNIKESLNQISRNSSNITVIDRYLEVNEYNDLISRTKFVVLPYADQYYNESSSGVIFDVLFNNKPVITKNYNIFKFVEEEGLGVLYENLNEVNFDQLIDKEAYGEIKKNIDEYLKKNTREQKKLIEFIQKNM